MSMFMNRKSISGLLVLIMGFLLLTGCSSKKVEETAQTAAEETGAAQEITEEEQAKETVLPADAKVGIVYTETSGSFTDDFLSRMEGYLVSAGVAPANIVHREAVAEEMEEAAGELIGAGCSVLVAGNADPSVAGAITKAASKAEIPVLYFGTDPGEDERKSWDSKKIRAAYVGGDNSKVAGLRAECLAGMDLEKIDFNEDGEIGVIVVNSVISPEGNRINRETLEALDEMEYPVNILDAEAEEEEEDTEGTAEDSEEEEAAEETGEEEGSEEEPEEEPDWQAAAYDEVIGKMGEYGRQLELIICAGDDQAVGAWNAVSDRKRLVGHDVVILGLDAGREILDAVAKGNIAQTFFDDSMAQSNYAAEYVLDYLRGIEVPYETWVGYVNVTVDNAQEILDVLSATEESDEEEEEEEAQG